MGKVLVALVVAVTIAAPRIAAADDPPFTIGSQPVWFLLGGVTSGGTVTRLTGRVEKETQELIYQLLDTGLF